MEGYNFGVYKFIIYSLVKVIKRLIWEWLILVVDTKANYNFYLTKENNNIIKTKEGKWRNNIGNYIEWANFNPLIWFFQCTFISNVISCVYPRRPNHHSLNDIKINIKKIKLNHFKEIWNYIE